MKILKSAALLANEHQSDQKKNVTNEFRINVCFVFVHAKTSLSLECQKMQHPGGFKPKWQPQYFIEYKAI